MFSYFKLHFVSDPIFIFVHSIINESEDKRIKTIDIVQNECKNK